MVLVLSFLLTIGTFGSLSVKAASDDYGNDFATAYNWTFTPSKVNKLNGNIDTSTDVDMIKFTASINCTYKIYSSDIGPDTKGWLYDSTQTQLAYNDDGGGSLNFLMTYDLYQGEVYYIKVGSYGGETGKYTLNLEPVDDYGNYYEAAYNCSVSTGAASMYKGKLEYHGDVDVFKFTAPATMTYYIYTTNVTANTRGVLYNSSRIAISSSGGYPYFKITHNLTAGQTYYIEVSPELYSSGYYNLYISTGIIHTVAQSTGYDTSTGVMKNGRIVVDQGFTVGNLLSSLALSPAGTRVSDIMYNGSVVSSTTKLKTGMYYSVSEKLPATYSVAVRGDVNGDGEVTDADLLAARSHYLNNSAAPGSVEFYACDMDGNGKIELKDILLIRKIVVFD